MINENMLKCLSTIAIDDDADLAEFFKVFPKNSENLKALKLLNDLKYIAILYADDDVDCICVNKKAYDYFKK